MENNLYNKGQGLISIIVILVVVGLVISSAMYFYFANKIPDISEITKNIIQENTTENITQNEEKISENIIQDEEKIFDNKPSEQLQQQNENNEDHTPSWSRDALME